MQPSGDTFFVDEYETQHHTVWETIGDRIDITNTTRMPYVWGQDAEGFIRNRILYRRGIITVDRQILSPTDDGYTIIAEGSSQYVDYIQMNFPCERNPSDPFLYHLNNSVVDDPEFLCYSGSFWTDSDEGTYLDIEWGDVDTSGDVTDGISVVNIFEWIDIWSA